MTSVPLHKAIVPSPTVLKFLRGQKDGFGLCIANSKNPRTNQYCGGRLMHHGATYITSVHGRRISIRTMSTSGTIGNSIESSLFSLNSIWARKSRGNQVQAAPSFWYAYDACCIGREALHDIRTAGSRAASTSSNGKDSGGFWRFKKDKPKASSRPNDISPLSGFLDGNTSLGPIQRPGNDQKLRCTEFDENGNVVLVNGEFKKTELIAKVSHFSCLHISLIQHGMQRHSAKQPYRSMVCKHAISVKSTPPSCPAFPSAPRPSLSTSSISASS